MATKVNNATNAKAINSKYWWILFKKFQICSFSSNTMRSFRIINKYDDFWICKNYFLHYYIYFVFKKMIYIFVPTYSIFRQAVSILHLYHLVQHVK